MRQQGFSLIELLMGLMIVGIVLHLVSPAYAALTESNRREVAAQSLISGIRDARTLATSRNQSVVIYAINGDWSEGWRIILDISGKGPNDLSNPVVAEHANSTGTPIVGNWWIKSYIRFSSLGAPFLGKEAFKAGTLHLCDARAPTSQLQVVLAPTGRVSLRSDKAPQALCDKGKKSKQRTNT